MDWAGYLNGIFSDLNITVYEDERIMANIKYLSKLFNLLKKTSPRVIGNTQYIYGTCSLIINNNCSCLNEK